MKPPVGKTSALTRSRTFTFVRRARFSLRRASWSIMGMHFSTTHATAAAASPKRSGVQKKPLRKIPRKCKARLGDWRGSDDELCEPAEVLRGCHQGELEQGTAWSAQAQTTQPEDPLRSTNSISTRLRSRRDESPLPFEPTHSALHSGRGSKRGRRSLIYVENYF
jgi:hypothetical protein